MNDSVTRRDFLINAGEIAVGASVGLAATASLHAAPRRTAKKEPASLAALREKGKRRRRRLIYNSDGGDVMEEGAGTPEGFLSRRFKPVLGTQVDSVFYCTGATTMFSHLALVGETYGEFIPDGSERMAVLTRDNLRALKAAGCDVLTLAVEFCHKNNIEILFSHRINDIHDTFLDWELGRWKREHPEYLLGTREEAARAGGGNSPRHWWSALNFERPEVLDYLCRIQEDVCERYDIDGVEIDYFRSPMFFRPNLDYNPATPAQVEILTGFQRRMRELAYRVGTKRGRPILMATRVPATPAACRHVGIDIARWLKEDLTDLLPVGGGYAPFTEPLDEIIKLAHAHRVPVYPTISASGMRGRDNRYGSVEAWRGAASNMWRAGADGIYAFNIFPAGPEPRFQEMGSPETLAGLDKLFVIDNVPTLEGDLVQGIEQTQILPVVVPGDGKPRVVHLPIGDDLRDAARRKRLKSIEMRVQFSNLAGMDAVEVRLNSAVLTPVNKDPEKGWITFQPEVHQYRAGRNAVSFRAISSPADEKDLTSVLSVEAHASYR